VHPGGRLKKLQKANEEYFRLFGGTIFEGYTNSSEEKKKNNLRLI
jgi:hypothetical protein